MTLIVFTWEKKDSCSLQDEVEHIPEWMAKNKLSQNIPKTSLILFLNWKDDNLVFNKTKRFCPEYVKYLGVLFDKNFSVPRPTSIEWISQTYICYQPSETFHQ